MSSFDDKDELPLALCAKGGLTRKLWSLRVTEIAIYAYDTGVTDDVSKSGAVIVARTADGGIIVLRGPQVFSNFAEAYRYLTGTEFNPSEFEGGSE